MQGKKRANHHSETIFSNRAEFNAVSYITGVIIGAEFIFELGEESLGSDVFRIRFKSEEKIKLLESTILSMFVFFSPALSLPVVVSVCL